MIEGLTFEPVSHTYRLNGVLVPNVTRILERLDETWRVPADVLQAAADLGTAVHKACELHDLNDLDEASVDPIVQPYLNGWIRFRAETGFEPTLIESRVYHSKFKYCGTLDRVGRMRGKTILLDIKSGSKRCSHGAQVSAYAEAHLDETGERIRDRYCIYLSDNRRYQLSRQSDQFNVFLAALTLHRFREGWKL